MTDLTTLIQSAFNNASANLAPRKPTRYALPLTAEQVENLLAAAYRAEVESRGCTFEHSETIARNIASVARWLTDRERRPWLLLAGGLGSGKSTLARAICRVLSELKRSFGREGIEQEQERRQACLSLEEIAVYEAAQKAVPLPTYVAAAVLPKIAIPSNYEGQEVVRQLTDSVFLVVDDLGVEPTEVKSFGSSFLPATDLLLSRYDDRAPTIISTNLGEVEIGNKYGPRVLDRLRELAEVITFENESFRKWN